MVSSESEMFGILDVKMRGARDVVCSGCESGCGRLVI